ALPGNRVGIRTSKADVAGAGGLAILNRELERRKLSVLARFLSQNLVHRNAGVEPRFAGWRRYVGKEPRARFGVGAAWPPGRGHTRQIAQHKKLITIGR